MSEETIQWLNENTLIGFTEKRGHAWHYRKGSDNHYPGAIPVGDVVKRLFHWEPVEADVFVGIGDAVTPVPDRKAIVRSDNGEVLGMFKDGYQVHKYDEWLIGAVSNILGDTLSIGSAGLLRKGGIAWVQVETPETLATEGVKFRPNLLAATSLDGTMATTYKRTITNVVCDNTLSASLLGSGEVFRVKHTRNSTLRLKEARDALRVVEATAQEFSDEIKLLTATRVTNEQWSRFLNKLCPMPEEIKTPAQKRTATFADQKRAELTGLWNSDERVAPWRNTAWGVLAATNTYQHHFSGVRGDKHRAERNMEAAVRGTVDAHDQNTLKLLETVLAG